MSDMANRLEAHADVMRCVAGQNGGGDVAIAAPDLDGWAAIMLDAARLLRQSTPDDAALAAAIAVFDKSATRTTPNAQTEAWKAIRAALSTRAATVPQGVSVDAARLNYVLGKVFFDRHGPCLPCGRTKIDQDMIAESIKHIDAAMTSPPAELGKDPT